MYKVLLSFIVGVLLFSFIIGQCTDSEIDYNEFQEQTNYVEECPKSKLSSPSDKELSSNSPQKEYFITVVNPSTEGLEYHPNQSEENNQLLIDPSNSLEIPRLVSMAPNQVLKRKGYTTSYNSNTKNANWVAWNLTSEHSDGVWSRRGISYIEDDEVIGPKQELDDWKYHNLPIDHGHMCPAGDNKWDKDAMVQSFLLTNMCPQNSNLNRGEWERLESRCRGWARHYGEIYIVAGPIFYSSDCVTIGHNDVGVPDAFYKVILRLGKQPAALGFIFPNKNPKFRMEHYVMTVDEVEEKTNIDFFFNLPDEIEVKVEAEADLHKW